MKGAQNEPHNSLLDFETKHPEAFSDAYTSKVTRPHSGLLSKVEWEVRLVPVVLLLAILALVMAGFASHFVEPLPNIGGIILFIILLIIERAMHNKCEYGD